MSKEVVIELIGWLGVIFYVAAYLLLSTGALKSNSYRFHILNMLGAAGLITDAAFQGDRPNLVVNILWFVIGVYALSKRFFTSGMKSSDNN